MTTFPETRDTPGGGMEVLETDGVWRTVPFVLQEFMRSYKPAAGFTVWEWMIGQVYAAGTFPPRGISGTSRPTDAEDDKIVGEFLDAYKARFPEQVQKFVDYMGWGRKGEKA